MSPSSTSRDFSRFVLFRQNYISFKRKHGSSIVRQGGQAAAVGDSHSYFTDVNAPNQALGSDSISHTESRVTSAASVRSRSGSLTTGALAGGAPVGGALPGVGLQPMKSKPAPKLAQTNQHLPKHFIFLDDLHHSSISGFLFYFSFTSNQFSLENYVNTTMYMQIH